MEKTFLLDYDDTLAWNLHDYTEPLLRFVRFIVHEGLGKRHAPDVSTIIKTQEKFDHDLVARMGFVKERFPTSFRETYLSLCEGASISFREDHAQKAYDLGTGFYDFEYFREQGLIEGVPETLEFLLKQKDELLLVTKGEKSVQEMKIEATGIAKYFHSIHIVDSKTPEMLREIIGSRDYNLVYMVGNSIKSDINPATEMGVKAIYIPRETWLFEKNHNGMKHPELVTAIKDIRELPEIYHKL